MTAVKELGFTRPTPIQTDSIPPARDGRDVLACAQTGSGKTAAFLLPILHRMLAGKRGTTRALIVVPTRELALQVLETAQALSVHTPLTSAAIYGGVGMGPQEHAFRTKVDLMVATPGRLLDHMTKPYASLAGVQHLVLDEADRMLDMGFLPDIKRILGHLPVKKQVLLFSATMPDAIIRLSKELLKDAAQINLERKSAPASGITQALYPVSQDLKPLLFVKLLERGDMKEALVFTRTKHRANRLFELLEKHGVKAARIHGNRSQAARVAALDGFKNGSIRVLVATDVAARGIDVADLGHVVNFDVPAQPEDYIHRVGRTGRAEATGDAFTFVSPEEENDVRAIEKAVGRRLPRVTLPDFDYAAKTAQQFEVPIAERIKEIRARKAADRQRAAEKAARKVGGAAPAPRAAAGARGSGASAGSSRPAPSARPAGEGARPSRPAADGTAPRRRRRGGGGGRGTGGGSPYRE
ncbi:MAG: DEAD/DEAH box helicase [Gemmatimonadaceae bacterium]|nr:DEAD/DEAH box helicase [Gemmatimonadaceae bacterium]